MFRKYPVPSIDDIFVFIEYVPVGDPGEGPGGGRPPNPLFLDQTEVRRAEKNRPTLSQGLDDLPPPPPPPPPPHLKVWILHCVIEIHIFKQYYGVRTLCKTTISCHTV